MTAKQPVEPRNVSLYPDDWQTVARVADTSGVRSLSAALRIIIREFERQQAEEEEEEQHGNLITVS